VRSLLACVSGAALFAAAPAHAAWYQASSKHFVIYADESPNDLRDFATKLERFDQGARVALTMDDPTVGNGNRLTVFVVPTEKDVRSIMGDKSGWFAGFYTGRVSGSLAYLPKRSDDADSSTDPLFFHEYTHHLMMQVLDRPYPEWFVEGFAELLSTARFDRDGSILFGAPLQQRAYTLLNGSPPSFEQLAAGLQPKMTAEQLDAFYGRGWLLAHYLMLEKNRQGQLPRYINALAKGEAPLVAAREIFGDLKQLDDELNKYLTKPMSEFKIQGSRIKVGSIDVQPMSPGASAVILLRARMKNGVGKDELEPLAAQVRAVESRFQGDEMVESTLAEAELDAGHPEGAEHAAERALAANPKNSEALVLEGRATEEKAKGASAEARANLFKDARATFIAANKLDTEDPEPLYEYYSSYVREGIRPTDNAIAALHYASDLAPQDLGVRMNSAIAYLEQDKLKEARSTLSLVAYSPHAKEVAEVAQRMIADIDAGNGKAALMETRRFSTEQSGSR